MGYTTTGHRPFLAEAIVYQTLDYKTCHGVYMSLGVRGCDHLKRMYVGGALGEYGTSQTALALRRFL